MADLADEAQQREEHLRAAALTAARLPPAPDESARNCISCGETIPEKRRAAVKGVQTCAFCQTQAESGRR